MAEDIADRKMARLAWSRAIVALVVAALVMAMPTVRAWAYPEIAEYVEVTDIYGNPLTAGEIDISVLQQGIYVIDYPQRRKQLQDPNGPIANGLSMGLRDGETDAHMSTLMSTEAIRNDEGFALQLITFLSIKPLTPGHSYTFVVMQIDSRIRGYNYTGKELRISLTVTGGEEEDEGEGSDEGEGEGSGDGDEGQGVGESGESTGEGDASGADSGSATNGEGTAETSDGAQDATASAETDDATRQIQDASADGTEGLPGVSLQKNQSSTTRRDTLSSSKGVLTRDSKRLDEQSAAGAESAGGSEADASSSQAGAARAGGGLAAGGGTYRVISHKPVPAASSATDAESSVETSPELVLAGYPLLWLVAMTLLLGALPLALISRPLIRRYHLNAPSRLSYH